MGLIYESNKEMDQAMVVKWWMNYPYCFNGVCSKIYANGLDGISSAIIGVYDFGYRRHWFHRASFDPPPGFGGKRSPHLITAVTQVTQSASRGSGGGDRL